MWQTRNKEIMKTRRKMSRSMKIVCRREMREEISEGNMSPKLFDTIFWESLWCSFYFSTCNIRLVQQLKVISGLILWLAYKITEIVEGRLSSISDQRLQTSISSVLFQSVGNSYYLIHCGTMEYRPTFQVDIVLIYFRLGCSNVSPSSR